jgi:hypothetical protein
MWAGWMEMGGMVAEVFGQAPSTTAHESRMTIRSSSTRLLASVQGVCHGKHAYHRVARIFVNDTNTYTTVWPTPNTNA